ncbi:hypothetical protein ACVIIV_006924 [Bradyrhizobium sp. USDA 4354]
MQLWLIPTLYAIASVAAGFVVPRLESTFLAVGLNLSTSSAQAYLSAVASGMMALTGIVFSIAFHFGRGLAYEMVNIYLVKTASVFMMTTSTIALYTGLTPRWLAYGGYAVAAVLLIGSYYIDRSLVVFPFWVLLVSINIWLKKHEGEVRP